MRFDLPSGTVTFLFTDVEGSTKLLHGLGAEGYADALAEHRRLIREACASQGGVEVDTQGDAFFFAFPTAPGALEAAQTLTEALDSGPIQVRVGLHTGTPLLTDEGYVGDDVHFGARVAASAHGGQVVCSAATAALVEPTDTVSQGFFFLDLGEHRLKDIAEAVSIYQLGDGPFPPLKTISNTNLPRPASSFVGRARELQEVLARLERGARVVTLSGPGGSGKTRLALEAAATLVPEYKAGVFWVGLAALRDPALVIEAISQTLGAKDGLAEHIAEREMLLLLDNLEQVIEATPELSQLLSACPNLRLLVTSRELLRVQGEVEYSVPPLAEPEAVTLFCERAQLEPSEEISELCVRLDSLPLAVELAAARAKALSPAQILERLSGRLDLLKGGRDADPRQQTLRATIEWSYDLLSSEEQQLFARLSVFAGGCTLEAAEEVADADLDLVQSLVEKSLLRFTVSEAGSRYWLLEMIREFAWEQMEASGEADELRERHAEHFLALAEDADSRLAGSDLLVGLDRLELEHDNLRAALDSLEAAQRDELSQRLVAALCRFWAIRGHGTEARRRIAYALGIDGPASPTRAKVLDAAAYRALDDADPIKAREFATESISVKRELGDSRGAARTLILLAEAAADDGDFGRACSLAAESAERLGRIGDEEGFRAAMHELGWMSLFAGDTTRSRAVHEENLARCRAAGDDRIAAASLELLALIATKEGRLAAARDLLEESYAINRRLGYRFGMTFDLDYLAALAAGRGEPQIAARLLARAEALRSEIGMRVRSADVSVNQSTLRSIQGQLDDDEIVRASAEGAAMSSETAVEQALASID
ncbi:MAG: adenylate/guanylate cyclase domain-containing protein [Actinobacteria bacterium]|nr:adenylate/guanylate cyclase domain-containing protein [Actinomycetota bacterium]